MLPTPSTRHINLFDSIYEPAEDSFLLLDTLSSPAESKWLQCRFQPDAPAPLVAEIGTGSGVVIAFLLAHTKVIFGTHQLLGLGVDVNHEACEATTTTVLNALTDNISMAIYLGSICADLCGCLIDESVDVLVFNPPYVPTPELPKLPSSGAIPQKSFDNDSHLLSLSYAGGRKGMETTSRLLDQLPRVLSPRGVAYIMFCAQNEPAEVKAWILREWPEWNVETVGSSGKKAGWESLEILRIWRVTTTK